jgi:hypothetical protein
LEAFLVLPFLYPKVANPTKHQISLLRRRRLNMMLIKRWRGGVATLFGLLLFIPVAQAEQVFDCTQCVSSTHIILSATEELTVRSSDAKGIIMSNLENKVFDNMTTH